MCGRCCILLVNFAAEPFFCGCEILVIDKYILKKKTLSVMSNVKILPRKTGGMTNTADYIGP